MHTPLHPRAFSGFRTRAPRGMLGTCMMLAMTASPVT
jgi:hypothetical protein